MTSLRIYDNGGRSLDRYTIIPPRHAGKNYRENTLGAWVAIASSERPFNAQGFGQHVSAVPGKHLGKRISWDALPEDVQVFAAEAFPAFAFDIETMARHFAIAAQWADSQEGTRPRISAEAMETARAFVLKFVTAFPRSALQALRAENYGSHPDAGSPAAAFGHDLYLTCAGHGTGFWDREELGALGQVLGDAIRADWRRWHIEADQSRGWLYLMR